MAKWDDNGKGQPHRRKINGEVVWQAVKVVTKNYLVPDPNGNGMVEVKVKKKLTGTGPTQAVAAKRLSDRYDRYRVLAGELPLSILAKANPEVSTTLAEWLDKWFVRKETEGDASQETLDMYRGQAKRHIIPELGDRPIRLISKKEMDRFIWETLPAKRKKRKNPTTGKWETTNEPLLSASPIRNIWSLLNMAFTQAVADDVILANPMTGVKAPKKQGVTPEREARIRDHQYIPRRIWKDLERRPPELGRWVLVFMGLRAGERLGIEMSSFRYLMNPNKKTVLTIDRQLIRRADGTYYVKRQTKTKSGNRTIILPDSVSKELVAWNKQREKWKKSPDWKPDPGMEDLFFTSPTGQHIRKNSDRKAWASLLASLKLPHENLHSFRHLSATRLGEKGTHPDIAKAIFGWSSEIMNSYYSHYSAEATEVPLELLAGEFAKDVKPPRTAVTTDKGGVTVDVEAVPGLTDALGITDPTETPDA